eukprot:CAMPEP_0116124830 /NCGR_PEP_ID=MMETSP0329-20121206/5490_1 /TAXON_ID=697910 /ORGANISM="Pseudo-nitzschia arenysensis, Strain B593" /LENGTH=612 /DNA_ID=CAMNT_0003618837 /DNA_START=191 /DNA_END=2029 /DNA_ORIENTATION=-
MKRVRSDMPRTTASFVFRLAILSIAAIGHGKNYFVADAFNINSGYISQIGNQYRNSCHLRPAFLDLQARVEKINSGRHQPMRTQQQQQQRSTFSKPLSTCTLSASLKGDGEGSDTDSPAFLESISNRLQQAFLPSLAVVWWPLFAAMGIPALVNYARSFPPNSSEQFAAVTVLIVANRIYLYALGLTIVATAAVRGASSGDPKELGQRLTALTEELLVFDKPLTKAPPSNVQSSSGSTVLGDTEISSIEKIAAPSTPSFVKKMVDDSGLEENLDGVDAGTQALVLPALVAGLLAISVVSLPIFSDGFLATPNDASINAEWISQLEDALSKVLPFLSQAWNAILLTLFTRAEFRRIGCELLGIGSASKGENMEETAVPKSQIIVECLLAVGVTAYGAYYLQYWPAQNFVNSAIAILVARAIRLDSFNAVTSALALLAIYDGASVLLIPGAANAAMDAVASVGATGNNDIVDSSLTLAAAANPASSAMGSVAMQKLNSGGFQPGLLVTKLDGDKLTGTLGLGDAVFPSILASFLKRFDEDSDIGHNEEKSRLFEASLGGYMLGCLACEFAPTIATRGVPALVFIIPFMGLATLVAAVQTGRLEELRQYNNEATE